MSTQGTKKQLEEAGIIAAVLTQEGGHCLRVELERLPGIDPAAVAAALARLSDQGTIRQVGDGVEIPDAAKVREKADQLGGVVSHTLIHEGRGGLTVEQVAGV
jgi:pyridoxal biosynthesis lyase PdxS